MCHSSQKARIWLPTYNIRCVRVITEITQSPVSWSIIFVIDTTDYVASYSTRNRYFALCRKITINYSDYIDDMLSPQ